MDWIQFAIFLVGIFGLFLWNRAEARADARDFNNKLDNYRKENADLIKAIHAEMKDFHGRLCAIEEKNKFRAPSSNRIVPF